MLDLELYTIHLSKQNKKVKFLINYVGEMNFRLEIFSD